MSIRSKCSSTLQGPPSEHSRDGQNDLSVDNLARFERSQSGHYARLRGTYSTNDQPPPIPPRNALVNSSTLNRRPAVPPKINENIERVPSYSMNTAFNDKKQFIDENSIRQRQQYEYQRPFSTLGRQHSRKEHRDNNGMRTQFEARSRSIDRHKSSNDQTYTMLSMFGMTIEMSKKCLELSRTPQGCKILRQSKSECIPLLVRMIHSESDVRTQQQAREALRNIVKFHSDDENVMRDGKVFTYIEEILVYCDSLKRYIATESSSDNNESLDVDNHPQQAMRMLSKMSSDEKHRQSMCQLGALQTVANLVHNDHAVHGITNKNCTTLRRLAGNILTNLIYGDGNNKSLLCANPDFMKALVAQVNAADDDLTEVTANVLRNLAWKADDNIRVVLKDFGTVTALIVAAMKNRNESTLRSILSALWNLSAHCSKNKDEICMVDGALAFLVEMLTYEFPSKTLTIVENSGGILSNVSSRIAVNPHFRKILRQHNCLAILLEQLKSSNETIVSNACGTLWNLSARDPEDQKFLWDNGAVPLLQFLRDRKNRIISNGSKRALKNLFKFHSDFNRNGLDPAIKMLGIKSSVTLQPRKQREYEYNENDYETYSNVEAPKIPPPLNRQKMQTNFAVNTDRDLQFMEQNMERMSLQCNTREVVQRTKSARDFWQQKQMQANKEFKPPQNSTGTIAKRPIQKDVAGSSAGPTVPNDFDQITNFSLVYSENHPESHDVKAQKNRTFPVAEEDTLKCYDNEGTPHLSTANSITDLRSLPKQPVTQRNMKIHNEQATDDNSGISSPEQPMTYCDEPKTYYEEGTPAFFSRRDSFCSELNEEVDYVQGSIERPLDLNISIPPNDGSVTDRNGRDYESGSNNGTMPTTPGECASKTVSFDEYNLQTPMMFSRHSSLGSLASNEPALNDDIASVVSETSRLTSGVISPSEIPDSPSQTMPPSPRHKYSSRSNNPHSQQQLTFGDEVKTFDVENTPFIISSATSLSNLSFDDEPKTSNGIHMMNHISNQNNEPASPTCAQATSNLVDDCNVAENGAADSTHSSDDSSSDDESVDLEMCIREGMTKKAVKSPTESPNAKLLLPAKSPVQQIIRENPIGMLRNGGHSLIDINDDETNQFNVEDSPCNFSVASGFSDLTVGSQRAGLVNVNRLPCIQDEVPNRNLNGNRSLSPLVDFEDDHRQLSNQAFADGLAKLQQKASNGNSSPSSGAATVLNGHVPRVEDQQSDSGSDSDDDIALLQDCINVGMGKSNQAAPPKSDVKSPIKSAPSRVNSSQTLPKPTTSYSSSKDKQLLLDCISAGIQGSSRANRDGAKFSSASFRVRPEPANRPMLQHGIRESPMDMLRSGGNPFIGANFDETNRFHNEDSPCNFSIASGFSDLTIGSQRVGIIKSNTNHM